MSRNVMYIRAGRIVRILFLVCGLIPGTVSMSAAYDVRFTARNLATVSDNIGRVPSGLETSGYLLIMEGEFGISGDLGSGTVDLVMGGGSETYKSEKVTNADNFDVQLNVRVPWSTTGYVNVLASSSEGTEEPNISDINQTRVRTRRSRVELGAGRRATPKLKWNVSVNTTNESRFDRDLTASRGDLSWDLALSRSRSLDIKAGFYQGTEDIEEDSWTGSLLTLDLTRQRSSMTSSGYRLEWEEFRLKKDDGTRELSDMVSIVVHYAAKMRSGWSYITELGVDGIKPIVNERRWEPRVEISLSSRRGRRVQFDSSISTFSSFQDPVDQLEQEIAWTRDSQFQTGLTWNLTRAFIIEPLARYRYAKLFGNDAADTINRTLAFQLGTRWSPSRTWSLAVTAVSETIEGSEPDSDLAENSLKLALSGQFF